jgi:hypothetical protein
MYTGDSPHAIFAWLGLKIPRRSAIRVGSSPTSATSFSIVNSPFMFSQTGNPIQLLQAF